MSKASDLREAFWAEDIKNGGLIKNQYDEIKRVLSEKDFQWVKDKFRDIKVHAIKNTNYYKAFNADDEFPVVNKVLLIERHSEFLAKGDFNGPVHISSTSGSTGTPFSVEQDIVKRKRNIADLKAFGELCDYPSHEAMVFFRVLSEKLHRTLEQEEKENIYYIDSSRLDDEHLEEMYQVILFRNPRIIFSYPSTLVSLAKYIKENHPEAEFEGLKSVLMAGEGISEENRALLADIFKATVYRRYSDMELGILGQDMGDGGEYTLNFGSYYFECLKLNSDEPAESDEIGRIVITDLFNYAFPMIRYDTGDLGVMEYKENEFPVLKEIHGRVRDCVYSTDGNIISPARISVSMWGVENIRQWQFIQDMRTEYTLKINADVNGDYSAIVTKFKDLLGADANIKIELVDDIPVLSSNKRRAVICNYTKE